MAAAVTTPGTPGFEDELLLRMCRTRESREAAAARIDDLLDAIDWDVMLARLRSQRLVELIGARIVAAAGDRAPVPFTDSVSATVQRARMMALMASHHTAQATRALADAGIVSLPLKGTASAERLHGDAGLRSPSRDVDLLVDRREFEAAVSVLDGLGYARLDEILWDDGLPHYHVALEPQRSGLPLVELHWRVHWYEKEFTSKVLERAQADGVYPYRPDPVDDLALLMLIYARDGLVGLRFVADVSAWWDLHSSQHRGGVLDATCREHPALRSAIVAAAQACDRLGAVPRTGLTSLPVRRREALAVRLALWNGASDLDELTVAVTLNDLLLSPRSAWGVFWRHYFMQPLAKYVDDYGWDPGAVAVNRLRRVVHAAARAVKAPRGWFLALRTALAGRCRVPLPADAGDAPRPQATG